LLFKKMPESGKNSLKCRVLQVAHNNYKFCLFAVIFLCVTDQANSIAITDCTKEIIVSIVNCPFVTTKKIIWHHLNC
ncbi:MAG: hypothetical protein OXC62_10570, partial [Aestuariivita sp.]|nr:hypothetical protein [Aestuariivita sp.]